MVTLYFLIMETNEIRRLEQLENIYDSDVDISGNELMELVMLLRQRRKDLLETIQQISNIKANSEDVEEYSNTNDTSSEYYNEDARNQRDDLD